jgi:hypothetical protein
MSNLFERLRDNTGLKLLTKYGDVFRITKTTGGAYSASTGAYTVSTVTQDVRGKAFSRDVEYDAPENVETAETEVYLTASGLSFIPTPGMSIASPVTSTAPYKITRVKPIPESGVVVIYHVFARR